MTCGNIAESMHRHAVVSACIVSVFVTGSTGCSLQPQRNMFASQSNIFLLGCQPNKIFILYVFTNYSIAMNQMVRLSDVLKGTRLPLWVFQLETFTRA